MKCKHECLNFISETEIECSECLKSWIKDKGGHFILEDSNYFKKVEE